MLHQKVHRLHIQFCAAVLLRMQFPNRVIGETHKLTHCEKSQVLAQSVETVDTVLLLKGFGKKANIFQPMIIFTGTSESAVDFTDGADARKQWHCVATTIIIISYTVQTRDRALLFSSQFSHHVTYSICPLSTGQKRGQRYNPLCTAKKDKLK